MLYWFHERPGGSLSSPARLRTCSGASGNLWQTQAEGARTGWAERFEAFASLRSASHRERRSRGGIKPGSSRGNASPVDERHRHVVAQSRIGERLSGPGRQAPDLAVTLAEMPEIAQGRSRRKAGLAHHNNPEETLLPGTGKACVRRRPARAPH